MDCDLNTFVREILGKWGFTMGDWIYLQQAYEREKENADLEKLIDNVKQLYNETADFFEAHFRNVSFKSPIDGNRYAIAMTFSKLDEESEVDTNEE
jgi:uncharacterized protein YutD